MKGRLIRTVLMVSAIFVAGPPQVLAQTTPRSAWADDIDFNAVFDMYWRSRLISVYAGSRLCSLKPSFHYDDPRSPFRPIAQRLHAAGVRFEKIYPKALNNVMRPYQMPPSPMLCDDEKSAYEAIFAFETAVTALERLLDTLPANVTSTTKDR